MRIQHPEPNEAGEKVWINHPSEPSDLSNWSNPDQLATVVPGGPMPATVCGISIERWNDVPDTAHGWERLAGESDFNEPHLKVSSGTAPASGAVVIEPDRRFWVVSPTNRFGGYEHTFPKGKLDPKESLSLKANAIKEVYEESGLFVQLCGFLVDVKKTTSTTRYYVAERLGGNPAGMGWESQAVHLVPAKDLEHFVTHKKDKAIVQALIRLER